MSARNFDNYARGEEIRAGDLVGFKQTLGFTCFFVVLNVDHASRCFWCLEDTGRTVTRYAIWHDYRFDLVQRLPGPG